MATGIQPSPPLSPAVFAILLSLAEGEKHGYAMMKDARTPERGGVAMGPGTLYGSIERMMRDGLVEESGTESESGSILYRTTSYFLERLGLTSLEGLPELAPYLPEIETLDSESFLASS